MTIFSSFRSKVVALIGGLLVASLTATFVAVNRANLDNARRVVATDLEQDAAVFGRLISQRREHLLEAARLLASDFAFKSAYATAEAETIVSAMRNHLGRLSEADIMLLLNLDGAAMATTSGQVLPDGMPWLDLMYQAEDNEYGEASSLVVFGRDLFQMIAVPLLVPDLDAWIVIGFLIDQPFAEDFSALVRSDVSVLRLVEGGWQPVATTLSPAKAELIREAGAAGWMEEEATDTLDLDGELEVAYPLPLMAEPERVVVVLQRSLAEELAPFTQLQRLLIWIFGGGLLVSILSAMALARGVTRPVLDLAAAAGRIEKGDFEQEVRVPGGDEIARMARSFNLMAKGLVEKERVRDLLGKVVSPEVAEELMSREIELGGEEREVTVLFSDVRGFTTLCEGRSPRQILELLNLYLTEVSDVIGNNGGVVDKYIGDAVMALFGAPLEQPDAPARAVAAALGMVSALERINPVARERGWPELEIGVGVNSDVVVAGNMGSKSRLNYTVIGDGVNLASRLEGLTKAYGVAIVVSESTALRAREQFAFRELDRVVVKGKSEPVRIFLPLGELGTLTPNDEQREALFRHAVHHYRQCQWGEAESDFAAFEELANGAAGKLVGLYRGRIAAWRAAPPPHGWTGTHEFTEK